MNNELQIFNYEGKQVRTVMRDGEPWWVLKDVCAAFGETDHKRVKQRLAEDEVGGAKVPHPQSEGKLLEVSVVNESGLYSTLFAMQPEKARGVSEEYIAERQEKLGLFRRWVTHDVLPSIRKHGMYARNELLDNPELFLDTVQALVDERRKSKQLQAENAALETENTAMRPKARFADAVACSETDIPVGELAKILRGNGVNVGQTRLFEWMRENEFLMRREGAGWGAPTQKAMDLGLFRVTESTVTRSDGRVTISRAAMVTGKGQQYFTNMLLGKAEDEALTKIVLDERAWAQDIIRTQDLGNTPMRALACVARHYLEQGLDTEAVRERLNALYNKDNPCGFADISERILKEAGKRSLLYITSIPVTRRELQTIRGIDGIRRQRVAFALLALAKYQNHVHGENHDWVSFRHKDVFSMANVKVSVNEQYLLLNDLKSMGLLKYNKRVDNLDVRVLYMDSEGPVAGSQVALEIHDMRNLGHQYMRHWGGRFVECRACGAVVPRKSPRQMYCVDCAKLENAKRSLAFYHKKIGVPA